MHQIRDGKGYRVFALMITDVLSRSTDLLLSGDRGPLGRALGTQAEDNVIRPPGVMSRKKQVAAKLLAAL